ncbi:MAG: RsmE family RNA methyltransferase [Pirellulaceae bacterium]|nr:RsmE family RNA methyltransferase [Pirellulaceae bacterium]
MPDRFFSQSPLQVGQVISLDPQQSHHLLHVLRAEVGDEACLFDGGPDEYLARVHGKDRRSIRLEVVARIERPIPVMDRVLVAAPVPKGDRFRYLIEKLTELGVSAYWPLVTKRAVNPLSPSLQQKVEQWIIEACKQCGRNQPLTTLEPLTLTNFLGVTSRVPERYIACTPTDFAQVAGGAMPESTTSPDPNELGSLMDSTEANFDRALLVGPEGGFTADEIGQIQRHGWSPQALGPHVLRIETAAVAGAAMLLNPPFKPVRQS